MSTIKIDYAAGTSAERPRMYCEEGDEIRDVRLYRVTVLLSTADEAVSAAEVKYVLAHNEVEARRMALCALGLSAGADLVKILETKRLPVVVNGWGDNQF